MHFYIFNNGLLVEKGMSGSDQRAYQWSQIFRKQGHKITLIVPFVGHNRFKRYDYRTIVTTGGVPKHGDLIAYLWQTFKGLLSVVKIKKIGKEAIIYSSSDLLPDSIPALFLKFLNTQNKMICGLHLIAPNPFKGFMGVWKKGFSLPNLRGIYYFFTQRIIICLLKHFAYLVMVSNCIDRQFLLQKGFKDSQVLVTFGGVDFNLIPKSKPLNQYDAVWVGRLHVQKGIDDLYFIWKKVIKTLPKARIAIMAEPDVKKYYETKKDFDTLKKNIIFTGYLEGEEKYRVLRSSSVFLCPSYYESFGMVIAEAMAAGLPVIAYELPIYKEIYTKGMETIPIGEVNIFSKKVVEFISNPKRMQNLINGAKITGKQFSWNNTARKILSIIE